MNSEGIWWKAKKNDLAKDVNEDEWTKPADYKSGSKASNEIDQIAKQNHMSTDIKRAVFQAIVNSEDYLQAFEQLMRLNLKKTQ